MACMMFDTKTRRSNRNESGIEQRKCCWRGSGTEQKNLLLVLMLLKNAETLWENELEKDDC